MAINTACSNFDRQVDSLCISGFHAAVHRHPMAEPSTLPCAWLFRATRATVLVSVVCGAINTKVIDPASFNGHETSFTSRPSFKPELWPVPRWLTCYLFRCLREHGGSHVHKTHSGCAHIWDLHFTIHERFCSTLRTPHGSTRGQDIVEKPTQGPGDTDRLRQTLSRRAQEIGMTGKLWGSLAAVSQDGWSVCSSSYNCARIPAPGKYGYKTARHDGAEWKSNIEERLQMIWGQGSGREACLLHRPSLKPACLCGTQQCVKIKPTADRTSHDILPHNGETPVSCVSAPTSHPRSPFGE